MINGRVYDFQAMGVSLFGGLLQEDLTAIDYSDQQTKEHAHAISSAAARGIGRGRYTASGQLKMLREGFEDLLRAISAADGRSKTLYGIQFEATVSYGDDEAALVTDELPLCEFTKIASGAKEGDTKNEVTLDFIIIDPIVYNGVSAV